MNNSFILLILPPELYHMAACILIYKQILLLFYGTTDVLLWYSSYLAHYLSTETLITE